MISLFKIILVAVWAAAPARVARATYASLVEEECDYNTYMCCWTENENGVQDNTDVCSVETQSGDLVEYPDDEEGDVHCHGMVWPENADVNGFILPLYAYVRKFDHMDTRGYEGSLPDAPQCECIEKMPTVSRADCTTFSSQGLVPCEGNDLRTHYDNVMDQPRGEITDNLVETCDN